MWVGIGLEFVFGLYPFITLFSNLERIMGGTMKMNYPAASSGGILKSNELPKGRGIKPYCDSRQNIRTLAG